MSHLPHAPMPPPPGFQAHNDPMPQFDVGGWSDDDLLPGDRLDHGPKRTNSNAKKVNKNNKARKYGWVEIDYEGFMLEKLEAGPGEKSSWSRVGRRTMPFSNEKLAEISRKVREESRMGPMTTFASLSADQQGVITRLIDTRQLEEKDTNAEWVLECVRRHTKRESTWRRTTLVCKRLTVILKRQDRNMTKSGQKITSNGPASYRDAEIIDINEPLQKKKDQTKNNKQKNVGNHHDIMDMPLGGGMPDPFANLGMDIPPPPPPRHEQHQHRPDFEQPVGPPQGPPDGAIPVDQWPFPGPPQHHQQHHPHELHHPIHHNGPAPYEGHPFQPQPPFNIPGAFEVTSDFDPQRRDSQFQTRNRTPDPLHSRSRERRESRVAKRDSRVERKVDDLNDRLGDVLDKVEAWNIRDNRSSSEDTYRENGYWSGQSGGFSTPPSSPPTSVREPNGTLGRQKSYRGRDRDRYDPAYPRQHRRHNSDVMIEPYTNRDRDRRVSYIQGRRRDSSNGDGSRPRTINCPRESRGGRPMLHHANTYNDYPNAPVAERIQQRALPQYPSEDYDFANYGRGRERCFGSDRRRSRRESRVSGRESGWGDDRDKYYDDRRERVGAGRRQATWF